MFRTVRLSIIRSFSLYTQQWYMSYRFADSLRTGSEWSSVLVLLASCQQNIVTYTIAVCTVKNWRWTEELSETCRVLFQNKLEKLTHLVGFIIRIFHDARSPERQKQQCSSFVINTFQQSQSIALSSALRISLKHFESNWVKRCFNYTSTNFSQESNTCAVSTSLCYLYTTLLLKRTYC